MSATYESCGGCGAKTPSERCIGCLHDFGTGPIAPSNANTSGLEVVAWRTRGPMGGWMHSDSPPSFWTRMEPLVTAASAQAKLDEIGMLVRMLVQHVPETKQIRAKALDYLLRHDLMGSPLREDAALQQEG